LLSSSSSSSSVFLVLLYISIFLFEQFFCSQAFMQ
jgi:hypothetical protein